MKKSNLRLVTALSVVAVLSLMTACNRTPSAGSSGGSAGSNAPGCSSNPYLMKYGCSIERIQSAAEAGNPDAQYALGYMYYYGIDTVKDKDTASLWIQRAAQQGQPLARKAWTLINTGAFTGDLHEAASKQVSSTNVVTPQPPEDVDQMNQKAQSGSVNNELPGYGKQKAQQNSAMMTTGQNTDKLHDSRLAQNAKPITANPQGASTQPMMAANNAGESVNPSENVARVAQHEGGYTVQLLASAKQSDIIDYISAHHLGTKAHAYETHLNGKPWYMLTYGHYQSERQAHMALRELPADMQHHQPWVKSFATVEKEVMTQKVVA